MKRYITLGLLVALILSVGVVLALPTLPGKLPNAANIASPAIDENEVKAPPESVAQLPESKLTKIVFIRYAPGFQKDKPCDKDGVCEPRENWKNCPNDCTKGNGEEPAPETTCYGFLAGSKPRWNWLENYSYNDSSLLGPSASAVSTWENATSGDIFGDGLLGSYTWGVYDYINSISYGDYPEEGVIGVTAIWYRGKNIYEYDIMFDIDFFPGSFDLPTVTLHEFGHGAGLGDLYDSDCVDEVMYGRLSEGEVKTDLRDGDIAGIQELYGA